MVKLGTDVAAYVAAEKAMDSALPESAQTGRRDNILQSRRPTTTTDDCGSNFQQQPQTRKPHNPQPVK
jgi:hypothetical protein